MNGLATAFLFRFSFVGVPFAPPASLPLPLCEEYVVRERARAADREGRAKEALSAWLRVARLCRDEAFLSCGEAAERVVALVGETLDCRALAEARRLAPKGTTRLRQVEIHCAIETKRLREAFGALRTLIVWHADGADGRWAKEVALPKFRAAGGAWPPFSARERLDAVIARRGTAGRNQIRHDEVRQALADLGNEWERAGAEPVLRRQIPFEIAVTDYRAGSLDAAERAFRAFVKAARTADEADRYRLWLAWTLQKKGDHREAARLFDALYARHPREEASREHLARAVGAYKRVGDVVKAAKAYERIGADYPAIPAGAEAAHLAVRVLFDAGLYKQARASAFRFLRRFASSKRRREVEWVAAWCTYRLGELKAAMRAFLALAGRGGPAEGALFWAAVAREKLGDKRGADALLARVAKEQAPSYYGHLARGRLARFAPAFAPAPASAPISAPPAGSAVKIEPRSTLRTQSTTASSAPQVTRAFRDVARTHPLAARDVRRAQAFVDANLAAEADATLFRLQEQLRSAKGGPKATVVPFPTRAQRATFRRTARQILADINKLHEALGNTHRIAQNLRYSFGHRLVAPEPWLRAAFPTPFSKAVQAATAAHNVPVDLVYAIMYTESSFTPDAVSPADARGLMQVLPSTGRKIAARRNLAFEPRDLADPAKNIDFGVWYLRELLTKFTGQTPLAIAAYNGGPHNVAAWIDKKGTMTLPEFLEEIPFAETRAYVRKVVAAIGIYRRLYGSGADVAISETLDARYGDNINF